MKYDRNNKFDFCYYGQVNSLRLKSSIFEIVKKNVFGGTIYFAGDGTLLAWTKIALANGISRVRRTGLSNTY